jgi:hypothetical protein
VTRSAPGGLTPTTTGATPAKTPPHAPSPTSTPAPRGVRSPPAPSTTPTPFANDPAELVLTTAHTNRSKSDQGPDTWAPTSHPGACWYAAQYAAVKYLWGLTPDPDHAEAERAAIETTLAGCTGTEGR